MNSITRVMLVTGWSGMLGGVVSGAVLGLFFHKDDWMGGYASFRRRLRSARPHLVLRTRVPQPPGRLYQPAHSAARPGGLGRRECANRGRSGHAYLLLPLVLAALVPTPL